MAPKPKKLPSGDKTDQVSAPIIHTSRDFVALPEAYQDIRICPEGVSHTEATYVYNKPINMKQVDSFGPDSASFRFTPSTGYHGCNEVLPSIVFMNGAAKREWIFQDLLVRDQIWKQLYTRYVLELAYPDKKE